MFHVKLTKIFILIFISLPVFGYDTNIPRINDKIIVPLESGYVIPRITDLDNIPFRQYYYKSDRKNVVIPQDKIIEPSFNILMEDQMVRRTQMQKQMNLSSTKADRLLKKAKKMNEEQFNLGGAGMKDDAMKKVIITKKTIELDPSGDMQMSEGMGMADGGFAETDRKTLVQDGDSEGMRGTGAMIKGTEFRGVF